MSETFNDNLGDDAFAEALRAGGEEVILDEPEIPEGGEPTPPAPKEEGATVTPPTTPPATAENPDPILGATYKAPDGTVIEVPAKFVGQPLSTLVKSYTHLESKVGQPGRSTQARKDLKAAGIMDPTTIDNLTDDEIKYLEGLDFNTLKPNEFAVILAKIAAVAGAREAEKVRRESAQESERLGKEVAEARMKHPLLASDANFRKAVLAKIRADENLSVEQACQEVTDEIKALSAAMGYSPTSEKPKPKPRTALEPQIPSPSVPQDDDETAVQNGILGAGTKGVF